MLLRYLSPPLKTKDTQTITQKENSLTLLSKGTVLYLVCIFEEVIHSHNAKSARNKYVDYIIYHTNQDSFKSERELSI